MPGAGLAVVEAEIVLGAQEALLNGPAQPGRAGQFRQVGTGWGVGEVIGALFRVAAGLADLEPVFKFSLARAGERNARPLVKARPFRAFAGGMTEPLILEQFIGQGGGARVPVTVRIRPRWSTKRRSWFERTART